MVVTPPLCLPILCAAPGLQSCPETFLRRIPLGVMQFGNSCQYSEGTKPLAQPVHLEEFIPETPLQVS